MSNTPVNFYEHIDNRLKLIQDMFSADGFFGVEKAREIERNAPREYTPYHDVWFAELEAQLNHLQQFEFHARAHKLTEDVKVFASRIATLREKLTGLHAHNVRLSGFEGFNPGLDLKARRRSMARSLWKSWEAITGVPHAGAVAARLVRWKLALQRLLTEHLWLRSGRITLPPALRLL